MKHIQTFNELNEGIVDTIKEIIFPSIYRVNYKVEHPKPKKGKEEKEEKYKSISKTIDIKAKDAEEAETKFLSMVDKEIKNADPKPVISINSIYKTKKVQYKHLRIFQ